MNLAHPVANGPHVMRRINRTAVLHAVRGSTSPLSVAELTRATDLSRPAVSRAVADLVETGLVERFGADGPRPVGRPAQRIRFRSELGAVAGAQIGPRRVHVVLTDLDGASLAEVERETLPSASAVLEGTIAAIEAARASAGDAARDLWAVGVGTPGLVDPASGTVLVAPSIPGWVGIKVGDRLQKALGCPVVIDNDVNLAAIGEHAVGAAQQMDSFAFVHWDERVGAGLFLDGRLFRGARMAAGELGFIDLLADPDRPASRPANAAFDGAGSFERRTSTSGIHELALEAAGQAGDQDLAAALSSAGSREVASVLRDASARGDATATAVMHTVVARFCAGLSVLVMLMDPGVVIIGGRMSSIGEPLLEAVRGELAERTLRPPEVHLSSLGDSAVSTGAVRHAESVVDSRLASMLSG